MVLHFPFCFLIRFSPACKCRKNLKRPCLLRISTNSVLISVYLLHTPSLEASKAGESSQSCLERCTSSCWVAAPGVAQEPLSPFFPAWVACPLPGSLALCVEMSGGSMLRKTEKVGKVREGKTDCRPTLCPHPYFLHAPTTHTLLPLQALRLQSEVLFCSLLTSPCPLGSPTPL